jgi:hypothetical protein
MPLRNISELIPRGQRIVADQNLRNPIPTFVPTQMTERANVKFDREE